MAERYQAKDRTVIKNGRDGLAAENLNTGKSERISRREAEQSFSRGGEGGAPGTNGGNHGHHNADRRTRPDPYENMADDWLSFSGDYEAVADDWAEFASDYESMSGDWQAYADEYGSISDFPIDHPSTLQDRQPNVSGTSGLAQAFREEAEIETVSPANKTEPSNPFSKLQPSVINDNPDKPETDHADAGNGGVFRKHSVRRDNVSPDSFGKEPLLRKTGRVAWGTVKTGGKAAAVVAADTADAAGSIMGTVASHAGKDMDGDVQGVVAGEVEAVKTGAGTALRYGKNAVVFAGGKAVSAVKRRIQNHRKKALFQGEDREKDGFHSEENVSEPDEPKPPQKENRNPKKTDAIPNRDDRTNPAPKRIMEDRAAAEHPPVKSAMQDQSAQPSTSTRFRFHEDGKARQQRLQTHSITETVSEKSSRQSFFDHNRIPKDDGKRKPLNAETGRGKALQKSRYKRMYLERSKQARNVFASTGLPGIRRLRKRAAIRVRSFHHSFRIIGLVFLISFIMAMFGACSAMISGSLFIVSTTYPGTDGDIHSVEEEYCRLERRLDEQVNAMESTHPGYDEYRTQIDEITHNPFQLASILSAKFGAYKPEDVVDELPVLLNYQYELNVTEETEIQERETANPVTGETETEEYEYTILNISLTNHGLDYAAKQYLTPEQYGLYQAYTETHGNRDGLFDEDGITVAPSGGADGGAAFEASPDALSDERFRRMLGEAEKYLGMPYVWGGSSPSTSFDCSGFVSWVINHSGNGWNVGRSTAEGLRQRTTPVSREDARPGDLVFFQGTYNTSGASHVGIYVGDGMMIHCGNPIQYASINTPYWQQHFFTFGRL